MIKYLVSEGYLTIKYTDETTMLEKEMLAPKYRMEVVAESLKYALAICKLLLDGEEGKDYMIFKRDEKILGKEKRKYEPYMLN